MALDISWTASDNDKHQLDITCLLFCNNKLYSGADDGKIIVWSDDLKKIAEIQAHPCSVFSLTANEDTLCSCSNDGSIKLWELETLKSIKTLEENEQAEFWKVKYSSKGYLFAGDDQGLVHVYKDNKPYGQILIAEPIKDLAISGKYMLTIKDLYLVITELHLDGQEIQFGIKASFMGRAPLALIGEKYFVFSGREGKEILLHHNDPKHEFKEIAVISNASELIINALAGVEWENEELFFSGGWDKVLRQWNVKNAHLVNYEASVDVGFIINAITCGQKNKLYVGGENGNLVRIDRMS